MTAAQSRLADEGLPTAEAPAGEWRSVDLCGSGACATTDMAADESETATVGRC